MIDEWKLVNYPIESGWIYLNINKIKRVVAEKVRSMIVERGKDRTQQIPEKLQGYIDEIKDKIKTVKEKYQVSSSNITIKEKSEAYPPCINRIINKTKSGFNLGHIERLILVFFLLNIELSVEEILNLFRMQPDFDEERARYYIEHAAGKIGGHTKYKPYNCNKLQSFEGICARDDDPRGWCNSIEKNKQIKNPIVYYSKMVWYISSTIRCPKCESRIFKDKLMKQEIKQCNFCKTDLSDLITSENVSE